MVRANILLGPVLGATGLLDSLLHGLQNLLPVDRLLPRDRVGDEQEFRAGDGGVHERKPQFGVAGGVAAAISASVSTKRALFRSASGKATSAPSSRRNRA